MKRLAIPMVLAALALALPPAPAAANDADLAAERDAVRRAVLDYVEGLYEANPAKIERSVHPDLHNRGYVAAPGETAPSLHAMTYAELVETAKTINEDGSMFPKAPKKEVVVYEVLDRTAAAKVTAEWGVDLMHLAKVDGRWKVLQVLWQGHPAAKP